MMRVIEMVARPLAVVRVTTEVSRWPREYGVPLEKVWVAARAGILGKPGRNVMVYRPGPDGLTKIECGVEVPGKFEGGGEVVYSETPAGRMATLTHVGSYDGLGRSHRELVMWCREQGLELTGVRWEVYGHWVEDPAQMRTDLFHQVVG